MLDGLFRRRRLPHWGVDDGIYLMLAPPRAGQHTIHLTAASTGSALGDFALDVTYHLTVK